MNTRKFRIYFSRNGEQLETALIELAQPVIDAVDDSWRDMLYDLHTPEEIAAHIGYNLTVNRIKLSQMDGWADKPNEYAQILEYPHLDDWEVTAKEE